MVTDELAKVVSDLRDGNWQPHPEPKVAMSAKARLKDMGKVVDATEIYLSLVENPHPVYLYEDHPSIAPPWESACICYVNGHGNVVVMQVQGIEVPEDSRKEWWTTNPHPVDWQRVRWIVSTNVFIGGKSAGVAAPTRGPVHAWRFAVYEDGEPADLSWVHLVPDYPMEHWDMAHLVLLGALNFCNCKNVQLVEPQRPRAEARRLERTGVRINTINVFSMGKRYERDAKEAGTGGTPLTSVRGHFVTYGSDYGKGLLFGKYAGRFWIPQTARGEKALGESHNDYKLKVPLSE